MLGTLCPPCQLAQNRVSADAHYQMTDYLFSIDSRSLDREIECQAYDVESMQTCPCGSCELWRVNQEANAVYEDREEQVMVRVRALAADPYYQSPEYLESAKKGS